MAAEAIIKVKVDEEVVHTAAEGDGRLMPWTTPCVKPWSTFSPPWSRCSSVTTRCGYWMGPPEHRPPYGY